MDVQVLQGGTDGAAFIFKMDLHQAEEVAHAQTAGASFTILLRPLGDNREVDRSTYGETTNRIIEQYNFPIPEQLDTANYPQPSTFPSPFPNQPYLTPAPSVEPSPSPVRGRSPPRRVTGALTGARPGRAAAPGRSDRAGPRARPRRARGAMPGTPTR